MAGHLLLPKPARRSLMPPTLTAGSLRNMRLPAGAFIPPNRLVLLAMVALSRQTTQISPQKCDSSVDATIDFIKLGRSHLAWTRYRQRFSASSLHTSTIGLLRGAGYW